MGRFFDAKCDIMVISNLWEVKMRGRKIIASILALTLIVGISAMTVAPASAATELNLNTECRREYGSLAHAAYDDFNNPYSWYCYK